VAELVPSLLIRFGGGVVRRAAPPRVPLMAGCNLIQAVIMG